MIFSPAIGTFGHKNIIKYCNRPFSTIEEHDENIIANANSLVGRDDRLFNLGDVCFRGGNLAAYRSRFICRNIFVVPGNHDREKELVRYFNVLPQCYMYQDNGTKIVLCHYAMRVWASSHHGTGMLYGHSHNNLPAILGTPSFDIGVDCWNYYPLSLDGVKKEFARLIALKPPIPQEHEHHNYVV